MYQLHKALYGLKQAPRAWFSRIEAYFIKEGFQRCVTKQTLFTMQSSEGHTIIVSVYVDDLIFTGDSTHLLFDFKRSMMKECDMTDMGSMSYFLGIEVLQKEESIFIFRKRYALEVLKKFGRLESNIVGTPIVPGLKLDKDKHGNAVDATFFKQLVGSLFYLTSTRPDLMFITSLLSRYMASPTELHLQAAKRALRYLKGTVDYGIFYKHAADNKFSAFTDSDYAGDVEDSKSTSGYVFMLSLGAISWSSKKQPIVTLSTTEEEYVATASTACQAMWLKGILKQLGYEEGKCISIMCDNTSTIKLSKNPVLHGRSRHIRVRYHFLIDLNKEGTITLLHCGNTDQIANITTKPLKSDAFVKLRSMLGMCEVSQVS